MSTRELTLREKQQKERAANWLLDAMLGKEDQTEELNPLEEEQRKLTADPFELMIAEQLSPEKQDETKEPEADASDSLADEVVNPLNDYMADW